MMEILNAQQKHWKQTFSKVTDMFGTESSEPARLAAELFQKKGKKRILELGGGQGRDSLFFAETTGRRTCDCRPFAYAQAQRDGIIQLTIRQYARARAWPIIQTNTFGKRFGMRKPTGGRS